MIVAKNLTKYYGDFAAIRDVSFEVAEGQIVGFLGPNGAGKSTTMKVLACYHPASQGDAFINGKNVLTDTLAIQEQIGYLPEEVPLYTDMTLRGYLDYVAALRKIPWARRSAMIERAMELCRLKEMSGKLISSLSKGYRQRTGLAMALVHQPKILLLDEPTVGLDPNQVREFRKLLLDLRQHATIVLNTHILSEVEVTCDRAIIIHRGKILKSGAIREILELGGRRLRIEGRGDPEKVAALLASMGLVGEPLSALEQRLASDTEKSATPTFGFRVRLISGGEDIRPALARKLTALEIDLLDFSTEEPRLEEIFSSLTDETHKKVGST